MRLQNRPVTGVPAGRQRDWIRVTTLTVPTVWMATADGLICLDLVAVELTVNGLRKGWKLTLHEAAYAADLLRQRGTEPFTVAKQVGIDYKTLSRWFPSEDTPLHDALTRVRSRAEVARENLQNGPGKPPARCGTYSGAQRHVRRKEPLDDLCRKAKRAADRHYKANKTYIGCPEFDQ